MLAGDASDKGSFSIHLRYLPDSLFTESIVL